MRFTSVRRLAVVLGTTSLLLAFGVTGAGAVTETEYNNIPSPQPGNVSSLGYEATSTSEFGGEIQLAGTVRTGLQLTVLMSSWGCESGSGTTCVTTPGATFSHPITARIYTRGSNGEPGTLVDSITQTFSIPYRPSASAGCADGGWGTSCFHGYATPITFAASSATWPGDAIVTIAYNTTHYGADPIGESASCYSESGGCGYDSLNVGLSGANSSAGSQPAPGDAFLNSSWGGAYCDGGTGGTGSLRRDAGCWTGFQPAFRVTRIVNAPSSADQCKNGGWAAFTEPSFRSQGDCTSWLKKNNR